MLVKGTYVAKLAGACEGSQSGIIIYETERGALCVAVPCVVAEGDQAGEKIRATLTLAKSDGTLMDRTIANLKEVFGWDGVDPFTLMDKAFDDVLFQIEVDMEIAVDPKTGQGRTDDHGNPVYYPKVKWVNPLGGKAINMPTPANRQSVLAKYGGKFRALSGGAHVKSPAPAAAPAKPAPAPVKPPVKPAPKAPVVPTGPASTMEEAWDTCCERNPNGPEAVWSEVMGTMFPEKTNSDMTPQDWGKLKLMFEDDIPV